MALALLGMPLGRVSVQAVQAILAGGAAICARAGIPVAGGHSIDSAEPIYGLAAMGTVHPDRVLRNGGAQDGDVLILTKAWAWASSAPRSGREGWMPGLRGDGASTTQLNAIGASLAGMDGVHAATDVTGFGLLGHALEMCRASGLGGAHRCGACACAGGCGGSGPGGHRHGCRRTQLGKLWRRGRAAARHGRVAARAVVRSADQRRIADRRFGARGFGCTCGGAGGWVRRCGDRGCVAG